jgi:flagellar operon protein
MRIDDSLLKYSARVEAAKLNNETKIYNNQETQTESFDSVLSEAQKTSSITFSKHAISRINERDIEISSDEMQKLSSAIETADSKGIKDSLILMNSKAFIVNVTSNVVVTVLDSSDISEQKVFTNLDGAVII